MSLISIGKVSQINRYPVKSLAGESLQSSRLETYGIYGDRCYAFIDETKQGWASYITARAIHDMLSYKAKLINEGDEQELPEVNITSPDGRVFSWDEHLLHEIQSYSKKKMTMKSYTAQKPDELLAVDAASILIITDASLRKLETIWGKQLDKRRFRANLVLTLDEDAWNEDKWIGKRIVVGQTELQADISCERCSMITVDPDMLEKDASLLKKVNEEMNLQFGIYASVIKTGQLHVGDRVYLMD